MVHNFIPMPQAMKTPAAKSSGGQGLGKMEKISTLTKVSNTSEVIDEGLVELETMDASEIYSKRLNAKEVIFPKKKENLFF